MSFLLVRRPADQVEVDDRIVNRDGRHLFVLAVAPLDGGARITTTDGDIMAWCDVTLAVWQGPES